MTEFSDPTVIGPDLTDTELEQIVAIADEIQKCRIPKWQITTCDGKCFIYDADNPTTSLF